MPKDTPYAGVASIFRWAIERGGPPLVLEDGRQRRDLVHVSDVADAIVTSLDWTSAVAPGTTRSFNVGSGTVHTIGDLAKALSDAASGTAPVVTGDFRLGDVRHLTASSNRIAAKHGWRARMTFEDGIAVLATAPLRATEMHRAT
jgi:dTDP-L-rhamnose 4-epimerase